MLPTLHGETLNRENANTNGMDFVMVAIASMIQLIRENGLAFVPVKWLQ
jgi:hypothetical protein